jgi:hypothetical protein
MRIESTVITGMTIVIPILLARYLLTSLLSKEAVRRAAFTISIASSGNPRLAAEHDARATHLSH